MDQHTTTQQTADAINDEMARQMELSRQERPDRRRPSARAGTVANERRRTCAFCHQPGDHPTPAHCLRALER